MVESFCIETFMNQNDFDKQIYLNNLDEATLINVFDNISLIHIELLDDKHLTMVMKNINIKKRILSLASSFFLGETSYNQLLNRMSKESFLTFMDDETIDLIICSSKKNIIIKGILSNVDESILNSLHQTSLLEYLVKNFNTLHHIFENIEENIACIFYNLVLKYYPNSLHIIISFNSKNQLAIIRNIGVYEFYRTIKNKEIFLYLDEDVITVLIETEPFLSYFLDLDDKEIFNLVSRGVIISNKFSRNKKFLHKISNIDNPNEYRFLVMNILNNSYNNIKRYKWKRLKRIADYCDINKLMDIDYEKELENIKGILPNRILEETFSDEYLEKQKETSYDEIILSIMRCDGLLPTYFDLYYKYINGLIELDNNEILDLFENKKFSNEDLYNTLHELTTTKLLEILIDRFYKDITYNFLINLKSIVNYFNSIDLSTLGVDLKKLNNRLWIYNKILNFYQLSRQEQIDFYNSFSKNKDYTLEFYEDFNLARINAYNQYNDDVFNLDKEKNLLNKELSDIYGVDIYELKGEPFYIYSHITNIKRSDAHHELNLWKSIYQQYLDNPLMDEMVRSGVSISLNGSKKIETFRPVQDYVAFGFCYLIPTRIAHVYHSDSYSTYYNYGIGMNKINEIYTLKNLIDNTCKYNEILYQEISNIILDEDIRNQYKELFPDYLLCYDDIKLWDIAIAKRMNLSILVVYTKYYPYKKEDYNLYYHTNEYIKKFEETIGIKCYVKR